MPIYEMLHGTSSTFLESIKENGLIPDSKNKIWSDFSKASYEHPSCKSLNGTYFTNNLNTAYTAAKTAIQKYPGDVLIISASIDSSTTLSDEDNIWCWIETWIEKTFVKFGFEEDEADKFLGVIDSQREKDTNHCIKWFSEKLHRELTENISCEIDYDLLKEAFYSSLMRRCSHLFQQNMTSFSINYQSEHKQFKLPTLIKTIEEAEQDYIDTVEKLSIHYTDSCIKESNLHTLRVPTSIGFVGKNFIKGMVVINDYNIVNSLGNIAFIKDKLLHHKNFALSGI